MTYRSNAKDHLRQATAAGRSTVAHAAESSKKAATKTRLNGEISLLARDLKRTKAEFGLTAYDDWAAGDQAKVAQTFRMYKAKADAISGKIHEKRRAIQAAKGEEASDNSP